MKEDIMEGQTEQTITTVTRNHIIEVANDHLTVRGEEERLTPDETEQLLEVLLIWRYGLEATPPDGLEG
jgi:hypothetical protein